MDKDYFRNLIQKYLNGNCTPEEISVVHEWYNSFEKEQDPIDILSSVQHEQLKQRLLTSIRTNIASLDTPSKRFIDRKNRSWVSIYTLSGIAAMVILTIGIVFFNSNYWINTKLPVAGSILVVNKTKSIHRLLLSDGSIVWLNPNSKVKYPKVFTTGKREIKMDGEVFFEVTPDAKRPFVIYSGNVITRVWGTSFRIRAYQNIPVEVSVVTGKVSLRLQKKEDYEIMLLPNQKATYLKNDNSLKTEENVDSVMGMWQKASMSFDNEPIEEVIKVLNRQFQVHISSRDEKLLKYVLNADFTGQNLPSILEMLEKSLDVEYEMSNQEILLNKKITNY